METYLTAVLLIAPGFIAKQTAKWLGDYSPKSNGQLEFLMSYFVYSLFSYCFIIVFMFVFGMVSVFSLSLNFRDIVHTNLDVLCLLLLAVTTSAFVGIAWQGFMKRWIRKTANKLNTEEWGIKINTQDTLLNEAMFDGKEHFVRVIKDSKELAVGRFRGASFCGDEKTELVVDTYPEYTKWLEYGLEEGCFKLKTTYLNFAENIVVEEYECPAKVFYHIPKVRGIAKSIKLRLLRRVLWRRWWRRLTW